MLLATNSGALPGNSRSPREGFQLATPPLQRCNLPYGMREMAYRVTSLTDSAESKKRTKTTKTRKPGTPPLESPGAARGVRIASSEQRAVRKTIGMFENRFPAGMSGRSSCTSRLDGSVFAGSCYRSGTITGVKRRALLQSLPAAALFSATDWLSYAQEKTAPGQASTTVYELRVYHTFEGKMDDLLRRFREHTMRLFERHGIRNVAYWTPVDEPLKDRTLFYILAHPSREAATANWNAFREDPEWQAVQKSSEANGKLVERVESTFLSLTDFSPQLR